MREANQGPRLATIVVAIVLLVALMAYLAMRGGR